jgi:protein-S-isoprenylcysteine O-methyltransferase Ste14
MHLALFLYCVVFFVAAFVWPSWRVWKRDGVNPLVLPRDDSAYGLVGNWFRAVLLALFLVLGALAAGTPEAIFAPLEWLRARPVQLVGWVILALSLGWIVLAQRSMGRSWRIGIDTREQPPLVQNGLFSRSRNPIFLGMRVNLLGVFLVLPNAATLAVMLVAEVLMQVQVRLEEEHLGASIGAPYREYARLVRRWL